MAKVIPVPEVYARDQMIAWFRSEFAAANAIIDAFCRHLAQNEGGEEYESVFAALHSRRLNWIPVLHNQKYFPIEEISFEIRLLEANRATARERLRLPPAQCEEMINFWESDIPPAESEIPSPEEKTSAEAEVIKVAFTEEAPAEEKFSDEAVEESIEVEGIEEDAAATVDTYSGGNSEQTSAEAEVIEVAFTEEAPAEEEPYYQAVGESIEVVGIEEDAVAMVDASSGGNSAQTSAEAEDIKVAFTEKGPAEEEPSDKAVGKSIEVERIEKDAVATVDGSSRGNSEQTSAEAEDINATFTEEAPAEDINAAFTEEAPAEDINAAFTEEAPAEEEPSDEAAGESNEVGGIKEDAAATVDSPFGGKCSHQNDVEDGDAGGGSQEPASLARVISADDGDFSARLERIKLSKGFVAKESVNGHTANVVKGLKMYEGIFTDSELPSLVQYINGLRHAGRRGELSGETFIFFNKQMKGNKREIIQFGVPLFQSTTKGESTIEPIPTALQNIIDHLVLWHMIPDNKKKPNSCIINFFDEGDYSQPYLKPPHLENPILTLLLSETTMAFGRSLISDHEGNYKGSLILTVKEGSLLVMRGNSADMARHAVCASPNKRMTIAFMKVKTATHRAYSPTASGANNRAMILWRPERPISQPGGVIAYGPQGVIPLQALAVMMAQPGEVFMASSSRRNSPAPHNNGTGVFLPWAVGPKKYTKHLPPRIQKRRLSFFPSSLEAQA